VDSISKSGTSLTKLLQQWKIPLDSRPAECMVQYLGLLEKWNSKINLTASSDWESIGVFFEEAIWANRFYGKDISRHLDIGSGAGFPAIILKILNPSVALEMVESREKRAIFLETVLMDLDLKNAKVSNSRIEQYLQNCGKGSWDCISWKGIKLRYETLRLLSAVCDANSQLWMFHGNSLAAENPGGVEKFFDMQRRERFPGKISWFLSVFHVKQADDTVDKPDVFGKLPRSSLFHVKQ
jgi:16S rRNA (guanine(527)-N(7))-methyltransferase RsmG